MRGSRKESYSPEHDGNIRGELGKRGREEGRK